MTQTARFSVRACADPQTLPRLIQYIAQLGLVPSAVQARQRGGMMTVLIEQADIGDAQARLIAEKMRASVLVEAVSLHAISPSTASAVTTRRR